MAKYINDETVTIQENFAPALKGHIRHAVELAGKAKEALVSLPHIEKDDGRTVSRSAHMYWVSYFVYNKRSTGEDICAGFGYDLQQWSDEVGKSVIPPWRIYIYFWDFHTPTGKVFKGLTKIGNFCNSQGYWDGFSDKMPKGKNNSDSLWLPVPKEFIRGIDEISEPINDVRENAVRVEKASQLLAGAVNAFLGYITR